MLQPWGKGLLGTTLRYPYEVRDEAIYFDDIADIQIPKDTLTLAEHILESKAADFDASKFHDRYEAAVVAMLDEKRAGLPVPKERPLPRVVGGTDLMAALRESIERAKGDAQKAPASTTATKAMSPPKGTKTAKRNARQREMLLPISGTGPATETPLQQSAKPSGRKKAG